MSLYPITIMTAQALSVNPNLLLPGNMIAVPLDMTVNQMVQIFLQQQSNTQDFSIRAWISQYQDGIALGSGIYPLLRFGGFPIVAHITTQTPPEASFPVLVPPGEYFVNILNLTNEPNVFGFAQTVLA